MDKLYKSVWKGLTVLVLAVLVGHAASAQTLTVTDLVNLQSKSLDEVKETLGKKGWVYDGNCGSGNVKRYCFNAADKGEGLAAIVYVEIDGAGQQVIEYSVFRPGLIQNIRNSIKAAALKLTRQETLLASDVKQRIYKKGEYTVISRGSDQQKYLSLKVQKGEAGTISNMQASK
ncbi:hypothetical protein GU926_12750 [Nibribacter ruber]|uniref:Beta-lactamase-inhibitor-like PepSY-like domain-containing protein n=1 Tax=Nibribacter ruber TaxID=2698458 RepID=A0A6P1P203_9BACT|nr:hypothetical protein [Nibribacter ruber]QHL88252.1 hypothetical protein GU926_12750 [Nibribacter ruber]